MSCRGIHFAITAEQAGALQAAESDEALLELIEAIEEEDWGGDQDWPWVYQTDKAWDAIHRCLTDGTLDPGNGPLRFFIAGGERLYEGDDYFLSLVSPEEALEAAAAARSMSKDQLRERYFALDEDDYGVDLTDEDFEYTWAYFEGLPAFFGRCAKAGRWVIFSVDQ